MFGLSRRQLLLMWVPVALASCLGPTLPLPPPDAPEVQGPDASGNITMTGSVTQTGAVVYALNNRTQRIVGQRTTSTLRYELVMAAQNGDFISLWYAIGQEQSPTVDFQVGAK